MPFPGTGMKKKSLAILLFFTLYGTARSSPDSINHYFISAARTARPSVVSISIYQKSAENEKVSYKKVADATGTVITERGDIITNYHVVSKGNFFEIVDSSGTIYRSVPFDETHPFLADRKTDIAVLRIDRKGGPGLRPVKFGDSNELSVGEWVIAIGNPYGLNQSISSGIVSSIGRDNIGFTDIEDFIQTDVSINPGNSGGPLINLKGEMVGINTAIRSVSGGSQGISFAIPSNIVKQVYHELIGYGRVRRGWLGFIAKENRMPGGARISSLEIISVMKNSPAFAAGIRKGDLIKKINGTETGTLGSLIKTVANKPVGSKISVTVSRDGRLHDFRVVLRERHEYHSIRKSLDQLTEQYGIEIEENAESENIVISNISPGSQTYMLRRGDVILSINDMKVHTLDDFIEKFNSSRMKISRILIMRNSRTIEISFEGRE